MAKKQNDEPDPPTQNDDPEVARDDERPELPDMPAKEEKRREGSLKPEPLPAEPPRPAQQPTVTPHEVETTRVLITGDDRTVVTEHYVPTTEFGFRIYIEGKGHFEHVAEAADSGTWIFAPTR
jgi:hypothetical protein